MGFKEIPPILQDAIEKAVPLSREEEFRLGRIIQDKKSTEDEKTYACNKLVMSNLRWAVQVCSEEFYVTERLNFHDMINEAILGLFEVSRKYDPSRECRFTTYASWNMRRRIYAYARRQSACAYVPPGCDYQKDVVKKLAVDLSHAEGREITIDEIALDLGLEPEKIRAATHVSNFCGLDSISEAEYSETEEEKNLQLAMWPAIEEALDALDKRDKDIICRYYGINCPTHTLKQIALVYMLSRERIRQIKNKIVEKLGETLGKARVPRYGTNQSSPYQSSSSRSSKSSGSL
jgi:RNA polymerase primary sigma factor